LLDQYFHREEVLEFHLFAREVGLHQIDWNVAAGGFEPAFFKAPGLLPLPSWEPAEVADWIDVATEGWRDPLALGEVLLTLDADPLEARDRGSRAVCGWIREHPHARSRLVHWSPRDRSGEAGTRLEAA